MNPTMSERNRKMISTGCYAGILWAALSLMGCNHTSQPSDTAADDEQMDLVIELGKEIVGQGFNAGSGYKEVWIRDYNTFIELSMEVMPDSVIRHNLNMFYACQEMDGNVPDGFLSRTEANPETDSYYKVSPHEPDYVYYKNTVETDQESSLVQAVAKYVNKSGNRDYLQEYHYGATVYEHLVKAMNYLLEEKMDATYHLLTGATTVDWGDVQPEHSWGVDIDENTHYCIDIYDNAMFVLALNDLANMAPTQADKEHWQQLSREVTAQVREVLWDAERQKFHPHIYLNGSPFPANFDEEALYYQGGTAVAILAGILTPDEVDCQLQHMLDNQRKAHAQTIGITVYPVYPAGYFGNKGMYPYGYQNGGDWTWFGARMVNALVKYGRVEQAREVLRPMVERVATNKTFNEWYTPAGEPMGSGTFRGEAGVLYSAILAVRGE